MAISEPCYRVPQQESSQNLYKIAEIDFGSVSFLGRAIASVGKLYALALALVSDPLLASHTNIC